MLDYLISLLDDSNYFSWSSAKGSHAVLQCRMEQGEIKDFTETKLIGLGMRIRKGTPLLIKIQVKKLQSTAIANPWCVTTTIQGRALNKAHTKPKGSCVDKCVPFAPQKMEKTSNILKPIVEKSRN